MLSEREISIAASGLGKCYHLFDNPADRLKQALFPKGKRRYQEFWALRDISFDLAPGESYGVIGRNGSGKSTLLQLLAGIVEPTTGTTVRNGRVAALLELGSGFNPEFSGRENVYLNAALLGLSREETESKFDSIVDFSELGDFIDQPVRTYSSGMFVRLAFSVVVHVEADVLIIDEALSVGDAFFVQKCMRYMREYRERGTLFFVSHDTGSVINMCDRALWLDEGIAVMEGDAKDVCEAYFAESYSKRMGIGDRGRKVTPRRLTTVQPKSAPPRAVEADTIIPSQQISGLIFNPDSGGFGTGEAEITSAQLLDDAGRGVDWLQGGEVVEVVITAVCASPLDSLIMGFSIKDRLGQHLIGDNTSIAYAQDALSADAGESVVARFEFPMPLLLSGEYSLSAAIASGTMEDHVQHHWLHDALVFKVDSPSLAGVLVGIPMTRVKFDKSAELFEGASPAEPGAGPSSSQSLA